MREVLAQAIARSDAVICCGGLGPTQDDITREVIADLMGVDLVPHEELAEKIRTMFTSRGRIMPENNLRQALLPEGAAAIPQQPGTAPGLICPIEPEGKVIYAVPGVPYEMKQMVLGTIVPDLISRSGTSAVIRSRTLRTWGLSESGLAELLADRITELDGPGLRAPSGKISKLRPASSAFSELSTERREIFCRSIGMAPIHRADAAAASLFGKK